MKVDEPTVIARTRTDSLSTNEGILVDNQTHCRMQTWRQNAENRESERASEAESRAKLLETETEEEREERLTRQREASRKYRARKEN